MISSKEEFFDLLENEPRDVRRRAVHDEAPTDLWLDIVRNHPDARRSVAWNKTIPNEIMEILARDSDWHVRCDIAQKRKASTAVLEELSSDSAPVVRATVASNPRTPEALLRRLLNDSEPSVRTAAAHNLGVPSEPLEPPGDVEDPGRDK
jgi:hypothetical protein